MKKVKLREFISIPKGSIKRATKTHGHLQLPLISIPKGSIKSQPREEVLCVFRKFQFQKVRLKVLVSLSAKVLYLISIPKGSIKRALGENGDDVIAAFQFQKVRLKGLYVFLQSNPYTNFNSKRFD